MSGAIVTGSGSTNGNIRVLLLATEWAQADRSRWWRFDSIDELP